MPPPQPPPSHRPALQEGIARLMGGFSVEATMPKAAELEALRGHLAPGTRVYLSALPDVAAGRLVEQAALVRGAGFEPVPHLAVRNHASGEALRGFLAQLRAHAGVRRVLVIAGDRKRPLGPFCNSLQLIDSGLLPGAGIEAVDIAGYPGGHPGIGVDKLQKHLSAKVFAARGAGLEVAVVTQFCFDAKTILSWLLALRKAFPRLPVRIGLAGPASARTLFRYALRCGVKASARGLGRGLVLIGHLPGDPTPYEIVRTLAARGTAGDGLGVSLHFYSFGGVVRTAAWAAGLANGGLPSRSP